MNQDNKLTITDDLVASFSKLLLNASGDTETLNKFQSMISDEIENASNHESTHDSILSDVDLFATTNNPLIDTPLVEDTVVDDDIELRSPKSEHTPSKPNDEQENTNSLITHIPSFVSNESIKGLRLENELRNLILGSF